MSDLFDNNIYVGIVGSRRRDTLEDYQTVLHAFVKETYRLAGGDMCGWLSLAQERIVIVSGGCRQGGDRFAETIAKRFLCRKIIHHPDKSTYLDTPQPWRATRQNYERNHLVARDSRDMLIACVAPDRTGGTEDAIWRWMKIHKKEPVLV